MFLAYSLSQSHPVLSFLYIDKMHNRNLLPEDVSGGEEALRDEHRVPSVPLLTLEFDHRTRHLILILL